jgi:hypothetical protein
MSMTPMDDEVEKVLNDPAAVEWLGTHLEDLRRSVVQHRFPAVRAREGREGD